jgi:hypothetical protein
MSKQARNVLLTGWIRPDESHFSGHDCLSLLVIGHFAGEEVRLRVYLADAVSHGYPYCADDLITRWFGNWLELSGSFEASPVDDQDTNPGELGFLEVITISITRRTDAKPRWHWDRELPLRALSVRFLKTNPGPDEAPAVVHLDDDLQRAAAATPTPISADLNSRSAGR